MATILVMVVLVPVGVWIAVRLENGLDKLDDAASTGTDSGQMTGRRYRVITAPARCLWRRLVRRGPAVRARHR